LLVLALVFTWDIFRIIEIFSKAIYLPSVFIKELNFISLIKNIAYKLSAVYIKSFIIFILFAVYGFIKLFQNDGHATIFMVLLILPFSVYIFNLGLISGDHLILTTIPMSFFSAYGFVTSFTKFENKYSLKIVVFMLLFGLHIWASYQFLIFPEKRYSLGYEKTLTVIKNHMDEETILICPYDIGIAYWNNNFNENEYFVFTGTPDYFFSDYDGPDEKKHEILKNPFWINIQHVRNLFYSIDFQKLIDGRNICFIEQRNHHPWLAGLFLDTFDQNSQINKTQLNVKFNDFLKKNNILTTSYLVYDSHWYQIYKFEFPKI